MEILLSAEIMGLISELLFLRDEMILQKDLIPLLIVGLVQKRLIKIFLTIMIGMRSRLSVSEKNL